MTVIAWTFIQPVFPHHPREWDKIRHKWHYRRYWFENSSKSWCLLLSTKMFKEPFIWEILHINPFLDRFECLLTEYSCIFGTLVYFCRQWAVEFVFSQLTEKVQVWYQEEASTRRNLRFSSLTHPSFSFIDNFSTSVIYYFRKGNRNFRFSLSQLSDILWAHLVSEHSLAQIHSWIMIHKL